MPETITGVRVELSFKIQAGRFEAVDEEQDLRDAITKQLELHPYFYDVDLQDLDIEETEEEDDDDTEEEPIHGCNHDN